MHLLKAYACFRCHCLHCRIPGRRIPFRRIGRNVHLPVNEHPKLFSKEFEGPTGNRAVVPIFAGRNALCIQNWLVLHRPLEIFLEAGQHEFAINGGPSDRGLRNAKPKFLDAFSDSVLIIVQSND